MAKGTVNKVILVGVIGNDPEVRFMPSGMAVANVNIATNDGYKDKQTGQFIESTEWHNLTLFGKQAESLAQYSGKGCKIYVEGQIKTDRWTDTMTGQEKFKTKILVRELTMLSFKDSNKLQPGNNDQPHNRSEQVQQYANVVNHDYARAKGSKPSHTNDVKQPTLQELNEADFNDDDIPF